MTFFKVNDPKNRELIKEVIAKRAVIREADRRRKMGEAFEFEQLSRFFKPITKQTEKMTEKIEKGVKGLPGEIAKVLPRPVNYFQPMQPPPAYEAPFATEEIPIGKDEVPEEENLPPYITKYKGVYNIGKLPINFNHETKNIINLDTKEEIHSPNLYDIFTNVNTEKKWEELDKNEKQILGYLLVNNKGIYSNYGLENQGEIKN